jgi:anti-anti-sigma factor
LVLDLAAVTFIDSTGLGAIVQIAGDAADADLGFVLARPSDRVTRILTASGMRDIWPIED